MLFLTTRIKRDFLDSCAAITRGRLRLITPEGEIHDFGQGSPEAELQLHDWSVVTACAAKGDIGLGETYVAGLWDTPSIADLCEVSLLNLRELERFAYLGLWARLGYRLLNSLFRANSRKGSPRNIRAVAEQQSGACSVAFAGGPHERGLAIFVDRVDLGLVL